MLSLETAANVVASKPPRRTVAWMDGCADTINRKGSGSETNSFSAS